MSFQKGKHAFMNKTSSASVTSLRSSENVTLRTTHALSKAKNLILAQQYPEGFWWYSLEANETIGSEFIMLLHYLGVEKDYVHIEQALARRILEKQSEEGSWNIYHQGPGDLSTTIECYFALKLSGISPDDIKMKKAREFILAQGGVSAARIFTKIHLALFGLIPWKACPTMPVSFMLLPDWSPLNIYEFSSWARACIVPLLVIMEKKKRANLPQNFSLEELFVEPKNRRDYSFKTDKNFFSPENFFIQLDKGLKVLEAVKPPNPVTYLALKKAERWIIDHTSKTEDIYPALAYSVLALTALGRSFKDSAVQKCFQGLLSFQQKMTREELPALPSSAHTHAHKPPSKWASNLTSEILYQQCCISPVWDTPWAMTALLESGVRGDDPQLLKAGRWLISKQITQVYGDWSVKNKKGRPGGWSFEFENEYFPDVDDTIQVLWSLFRLDLPKDELTPPFQRGLDWLFSMQSQNGGWAAFDVDNTLEIVNKIPFSDHGACLDPPTPDITGRVLEFLGYIGYSQENPICTKALQFILKNQQASGAWEGRWGVNYLYGTWCVLQGLAAMGISKQEGVVQMAADWIKSVQNEDGGWSESCESYTQKRFIPLSDSTPSQTAWAVMGLIAGGEVNSDEVRRGIEFLLSKQNSEGGWDEDAHTGTGFPGHFYIRYHGYRHYFPLLALSKYKNATKGS